MSIILDETDAIIETPDGRLARWKSKLLDLTLRNRLINFKPTKVMLPLRVPDPSHLEDELSDGKEWKFRPLPQIMQGDDRWVDELDDSHLMCTVNGQDARLFDTIKPGAEICISSIKSILEA